MWGRGTRECQRKDVDEKRNTVYSVKCTSTSVCASHTFAYAFVLCVCEFRHTFGYSTYPRRRITLPFAQSTIYSFAVYILCIGALRFCTRNCNDIAFKSVRAKHFTYRRLTPGRARGCVFTVAPHIYACGSGIYVYIHIRDFFQFFAGATANKLLLATAAERMGPQHGKTWHVHRAQLVQHWLELGASIAARVEMTWLKNNMYTRARFTTWPTTTKGLLLLQLAHKIVNMHTSAQRRTQQAYTHHPPACSAASTEIRFRKALAVFNFIASRKHFIGSVLC